MSLLLIILGSIAVVVVGVLLLLLRRLSPQPTNRSDVVARIRRLQ